MSWKIERAITHLDNAKKLLLWLASEGFEVDFMVADAERKTPILRVKTTPKCAMLKTQGYDAYIYKSAYMVNIWHAQLMGCRVEWKEDIGIKAMWKEVRHAIHH